jgi:hypothetical protein
MPTSSSSTIASPLARHPAQDGVAELEAVFASRRKFLEHAQVGPAVCRIFWPCYPQVAAGRPVVLHVRFGGDLESFPIRGRVLRARDDLRDPRGSGLLVEVTGRDLFDFGRAYAHASGRAPELGRRRNARVAVRLPARIQIGSTLQEVQLADLSLGGAFIATDARCPSEGTRLKLEVKTGWLRRVTFTVRVAWIGRVGRLSGMGVELIDSDARARGWLVDQTRLHAP